MECPCSSVIWLDKSLENNMGRNQQASNPSEHRMAKAVGQKAIQSLAIKEMWEWVSTVRLDSCGLQMWLQFSN